MTMPWQSTLPVDRYIVTCQRLLSEEDRRVLTLLYQPLLGVTAYSLSLTLWQSVDAQHKMSQAETHQRLLETMQLQLKDVYQARKTLEGLGLLKTFVKEDEQTRAFVYDMQLPLSPRTFFRDDVLSVYLYNRVGQKKFADLRSKCADASFDLMAYAEVTSSFDDVFTTMQYSELLPDQEVRDVINQEEAKASQSPSDTLGLTMSEAGFDYQLFLSYLSHLIVSKEDIHQEAQQVIYKLAFVYQVDPLEMSKHVERAYFNSRDVLDIKALRKEVRDWYLFENDNHYPYFRQRQQPQALQTLADREPQTDEEKWIRAFETHSPTEFLEQSAEGAKPSEADLKVVEDVMIEQKLPAGVVNVLLDYVLKNNNMKLNRSYVTKIAAQWARKKVKTVVDAMSLAKDEYGYRKFSQNQTKGSSSSGRQGASRKQNQRQDKLPKWMTEETQTTKTPDDWQTKKQQLEQRMKKYNHSS